LYNSDPDHAFDPETERLIQVFRVVSDTANRIMLMSATSDLQWSAPVVAFAVRRHDAVSPSLIIERDRAAKIWYVRSGAAGCNATSTTVELRTAQPNPGETFESVRWSAPTVTDLSIPGYVAWHLDVAEIPSEGYLALIAAFPQGSSCAQSDLWLATSEDGVTWQTMMLPIFWRGMALAKDRDILTWYRGTLRYDPATDLLDVWPSGLAGPSWTIYHTSARLSEITDVMALATTSDLRAIRAASALVPQPSIRMP
jgi:hypothetical protein